MEAVLSSGTLEQAQGTTECKIPKDDHRLDEGLLINMFSRLRVMDSGKQGVI
jgi:hypothetical protein